jgi:hypothetical protein
LLNVSPICRPAKVGAPLDDGVPSYVLLSVTAETVSEAGVMVPKAELSVTV